MRREFTISMSMGNFLKSSGRKIAMATSRTLFISWPYLVASFVFWFKCSFGPLSIYLVSLWSLD
ncbi:hypothetical protein MtrunA17_Chr8g0355211 [Medicago truncatula]|uniref:Uncharacterized protein n=1 Tax=Medicago truncatula TaxID=3880 RepID=A0A396GLN9_MEDTR|nr:hypothetical protein MtrunA17_Chr8g0355211 [Medicago truncatula]